MAKIEIEIEPSQLFDKAIDGMDREELQEAGMKILKKLSGESIPASSTVHRAKKKRKRTATKGNVPYSKEDKEKFKNLFLKWKGKVTDKRIDILARTFKRTRKAIRTQLHLNRKAWRKILVEQENEVKPKKTTFKDIPKLKDSTAPNFQKSPKPDDESKDFVKKSQEEDVQEKKPAKKKRKTYKRSPETQRLYDRARELKDADTGKKQYFGHYIGLAKKELEQGDSDTQAQEPEVKAEEEEPSIPTPEEPSTTPRDIDDKIQEPIEEVDKREQPSEFPRIFPLTDVGNEAFKQVCKDLIYNPMRQFNLQNARYTLNLPDNMHWNIVTWEWFLTQVQYNDKQIREFFNVAGSFKVEWNSRNKVLKFIKRVE
jgi:hypothetical protein